MFNEIKNLFNRGKGGASLGFATVLGSLITGLFGILVAPILGVENYGIVSYFLAIAGVTFAIVSFGASHILLVYLAKGIKIFSTISFITLLSSLIAFVSIFIIFREISIGIAVFGFIIFELSNSELLAKQLYTKYIKYLLTQKLIFVVLSISLYFVWGPTGFVLGFALSMFPGLIRIYYGFKESKIEICLIKERLDFVLNSYFLRISRTAYVNVDRLIVFPLFGFMILGNYELGLQIVLLANVFSVFIHQYVIPKDSRNESTQKLKFLAIIFSIFVSLSVIFLAPLIMPAIFPQFEESVDLVPILGLSIVPHMMIMLHMSKFLGAEKNRPILYGSILHLGFFVVAILVLGNLYSIIGVCIALVLAEIVEAIFLMSLHKKIFKSYL